MKRTTHYARIDRVVYEFDPVDIQRALMQYAHIPESQPGKRIEFEMWHDITEAGEIDAGAVIRVVWESDLDNTSEGVPAGEGGDA